MSLLNSLFPDIYGKSSHGEGTNLSSGGNPTQLQGSDRSILAEYASIPDEVTQEDVDVMAEVSGNLEGGAVLMRAWSEHALNAQKYALDNLEARITHAKSSMANEGQYRRKIAKHGKNVLEHRVDVSATKANLDGFQSVMNNASETLHL